MKWSVLGAIALAAFPANVFSATSQAAKPLAVRDVLHLTGLEDVPRNAKGTLALEKGELQFAGAKGAGHITLTAIRTFYLEHGDMALIGGTAGKIVLFAPFGSGKAVAMIRRSIDTLTVDYSDGSGGLHEAVLLLPKGQGAEVSERLGAGGAQRFESAKPNPATSTKQTTSKQKPLTEKAAPIAFNPRAAIQIEALGSGDVTLPAAFKAVLYEDLIEAFRNSERFQHVYRSGENDARDRGNMLTLRTTVEGFRSGNSRVRTLTFFGGATTLDARIQILDRAGKSIADYQVQGKVRHFGENIEVADNLTKTITKLLKPGTPVAEAQKD